jgi:ankyrin repeat protein
MGVLHIAVNF